MPVKAGFSFRNRPLGIRSSATFNDVHDLRLLPLISSATEIVHALGLGEYQIGRSHECDYPAKVATLPICTRPAIPVDGSSLEIDRSVKERVRSALSVYEVDSDLIRKLRPTHIITQTQCKVCAVSLDDVQRAFRDEIAIDADVIALEPYALADLWRDIRRTAESCGVANRGEELVRRIQKAMDEISRLACSSGARPRIAAIEWLEPLMAAGNWVPELIDMAGGENLFGQAGGHSPWMTWDELRNTDPDIIIVLPCGFDLPRTRGEMYWLTGKPGWREIRAVRERKVFLSDGNQFMNRPGPRLLESLEIFAEVLHPEAFEPRLEGTGWERFDR